MLQVKNTDPLDPEDYITVLRSVVYDGTAGVFGSAIGETLTFTFSNDVFILYGDQVAAGTKVHFETASSLGSSIAHMAYATAGNELTITVVAVFGTPRPPVGDKVTGLEGIVDAHIDLVVVPAGGVIVEQS